MKKVILIALTLAIMLGLTACGENKITTKAIEREERYKNLTEQKVPKYKTYTIDGEKVQLRAGDLSIKYKAKTKTKAMGTKSYDVQLGKPNIPQTVTLEGEDYDGKPLEVRGNLKKVETVNAENPFKIKATITGYKQVVYLTAEKIELRLDKDGNPIWEGYEGYILKHLNLPPTSKINLASFTPPETDINGITRRYATFEGTTGANSYIAYYEEDITKADLVRYDANVNYSNKADLLKTIAAGVGIVILSGSLAGLLIFLRKKRKEK